METSQIIKLTLILYKVTESFPKEEPLRFQVRERANNILGNLVMILSQNPVEAGALRKNILSEGASLEIKNLRAFLELAKHQSWTRNEYLVVLINEYSKVFSFLQTIRVKEKTAVKKEESSWKPSRPKNNLSVLEGKERCLKILDVLKQRRSVQVQDLQAIFPGVTQRTLRRDCAFLLSQGFIKRRGEYNNTEYSLS